LTVDQFIFDLSEDRLSPRRDRPTPLDPSYGSHRQPLDLIL